MLSQSAMARMARRIIRIANEIITPSSLEKRHKEMAGDILSLVKDIICGIKTAGISLVEQKRIFDKYSFQAKSVINMTKSFLMDGEEAIRSKKVSPTIYDSIVRVRDEAIIRKHLKTMIGLIKTKKYDTFAHSVKDLQEIKIIQNELGLIKRKLDSQIYKMKNIMGTAV